jgi:hypothetical protein
VEALAERYALTLTMPQRLRSGENIPDEAAELAEVASRLIEANPQNRRAVAELATILGAGVVEAGIAATGTVPTAAAPTSLPFIVASVARLVLERIETRASMTLPSAERRLWIDAGASLKPGAIEQNAINAIAAFSELVMRSVEGESIVAARLGVDRSRVSQRVRDRSLYAFSRGDTRYFPSWQLTDEGTLPGLRKVVSALDEGLHPLVVDHWFTTTSVDLEIGDVPVSPVTWLATGGSPQVAAELAADL